MSEDLIDDFWQWARTNETEINWLAVLLGAVFLVLFAVCTFVGHDNLKAQIDIGNNMLNDGIGSLRVESKILHSIALDISYRLDVLNQKLDAKEQQELTAQDIFHSDSAYVLTNNVGLNVVACKNGLCSYDRQ